VGVYVCVCACKDFVSESQPLQRYSVCVCVCAGVGGWVCGFKDFVGQQENIGRSKYVYIYKWVQKQGFPSSPDKAAFQHPPTHEDIQIGHLHSVYIHTYREFTLGASPNRSRERSSPTPTYVVCTAYTYIAYIVYTYIVYIHTPTAS
jgi:hypothetical protein